MSFWKRISPVGAAKDFSNEFLRPNPYRWRIMAVSAVATCPDVALWIVLAVVLALNLISERVSFSKVIAANRVLRAIDMAGRAV